MYAGEVAQERGFLGGAAVHGRQLDGTLANQLTMFVGIRRGVTGGVQGDGLETLVVRADRRVVNERRHISYPVAQRRSQAAALGPQANPSGIARNVRQLARLSLQHRLHNLTTLAARHARSSTAFTDSQTQILFATELPPANASVGKPGMSDRGSFMHPS
ncbi:MAG: hypothetical protein AMJ93_06785 [Anaerolineae bacterium SM23_84]|jgi:hypothetical protein|nr:MAG: hypothetical protein AMJ93_06785 [Anaerolineae bacterium SM23_84]